ncbi:hypothetical protein GBA52_025073, partial [Prunus armeniaca]
MSAATTTINSATRRNFISLRRVFPPTGKNTHGRIVGDGTCDVVKKRKSLIPIRMDPSQKLMATIEAQKLFVFEIGLITLNKAPLNVLGMKKLSFETKKHMALGLQ